VANLADGSERMATALIRWHRTPQPSAGQDSHPHLAFTHLLSAEILSVGSAEILLGGGRGSAGRGCVEREVLSVARAGTVTLVKPGRVAKLAPACARITCRASWLVVDSGASRVRAFLSHASEDKAGFVEPLARELAARGIAPWLDIWEIRPGDSLVKKLFDEGLDAVEAVIVVISASSAAKPWVREELDAAVVRRITDSTRLIPVRLDGATMPAPIQHLVWITADRTPEGIQSAAVQIADALYGRDLRPAVAPPPDYTAAASIPGLTSADSALLTIFIAEALDAQILEVMWPAVKARAEERGLTGATLEEAFSALEQKRYIKVRSVAGGPHTVELSSAGFRRGVDVVVPDAEAARQQIVATLVNDPPAGDRPVHDLAAATGKPVLFVLQFLRQLETRRYLQVHQYAGNTSRISVNPTLKRLL
jgi:hypothetical protein